MQAVKMCDVCKLWRKSKDSETILNSYRKEIISSLLCRSEKKKNPTQMLKNIK